MDAPPRAKKPLSANTIVHAKAHLYKSVLRCGFIVQHSAMLARYGDELAGILTDKLVVRHVTKHGPPKIAVLYERRTYGGTTRCLILPRLWAWVLCLRGDELIPRPRVLWPRTALEPCCNAEYCGELDANQQLVVRELMARPFTPERIRRGAGAALLKLEAGRGKTYIAAALIAQFRVPTLYIVRQVPLQQQAIKDLNSVLRGCTIGTSASDDVFVCVIHSALKIPPDTASRFGFVIYDEVHLMATPMFAKIFRQTMTWINLGLSGTPDRNDGMCAIYKKELALDGVIDAAELPGYDADSIGFSIHVRAIKYYGRDEHVQTRLGPTGAVSALLMQKQACADPHRMRLVAQEIDALYRWRGSVGMGSTCVRHGIYVFCEERGQLDVVYAALRERYADAIEAPEIAAAETPELDASTGKFIGGISKRQIADIRSRAHIYLTTYGYSSTGISNNDMTAIVFVTSRRGNMNQIIRRILRRNGDTRIPRVIVDIIDARTCMQHQYRDRAAAYAECNAVIRDLHVSVAADGSIEYKRGVHLPGPCVGVRTPARMAAIADTPACATARVAVIEDLADVAAAVDAGIVDEFDAYITE